MEKLIELLNEYDEWFVSWFEEYNEACWMFFTNVWQAIDETEIISKKFWFIQWLVENEKIDFSWEWKLSSELVSLFERKLDNAEWVIALLSIQDNPIEFLVSILK